MVPCFDGKSLKHPKATLEKDPTAKSTQAQRSDGRQTVRGGPQEFHINQQIAVVPTAAISTKKRASAIVVDLVEVKEELKSTAVCQSTRIVEK